MSLWYKLILKHLIKIKVVVILTNSFRGCLINDIGFLVHNTKEMKRFGMPVGMDMIMIILGLFGFFVIFVGSTNALEQNLMN